MRAVQYEQMISFLSLAEQCVQENLCKKNKKTFEPRKHPQNSCLVGTQGAFMCVPCIHMYQWTFHALLTQISLDQATFAICVPRQNNAGRMQCLFINNKRWFKY